MEGGKEGLAAPFSYAAAPAARVAAAVPGAVDMVGARTQPVLLPPLPRLPLLLLLLKLLLLLLLLLLLPKLLALVVLAALISRMKVAAGKRVAVDEAGVRMRASNLRLSPAPAPEGGRARAGTHRDTSSLGLGGASCVVGVGREGCGGLVSARRKEWSSERVRADRRRPWKKVQQPARRGPRPARTRRDGKRKHSPCTCLYIRSSVEACNGSHPQRPSM